jgi:hypothetical protein
MKLNRNHYFLIGLLLLFLGLQFRMVDTFVLNAQVSQVVRGQASSPGAQTVAFMQQFAPMQSMQLHAVQPPKFIGWILLSSGAVMVLQSFAMRRPG